MFEENKDIDLVRVINEETKERILKNLDNLAQQIEKKNTWDKDECLNLTAEYYDLIFAINKYSGTSKYHQENGGLVNFDFDPTNLIKINNFIKQIIVPEYEKNLSKPELNATKRKQLEKFLKKLNNALIFGDIYATGSFKQNQNA